MVSYDVDSSNIQQISPNLFGEQETFFQTTYKHAIGFWGGAGLTGALTGAYRYASPVLDSIAISRADQWKYFIVGIIAGGSGLYVGYRIGSGDLPSCDDERIKDKLQEKNTWKTVAEDTANKLLDQAYFLAAKSAIPELYTNGPNIKNRILSGRVDSGLFRTLLTDIEEKYKKLNPD